jgi:hypothetical protein
VFDSIEFHELDETFIPNLSAVCDFIGGTPQWRDGTGGIFFLRANSYIISYSLDARKNREQLRRDGGGGHEGARAGRSGENLGSAGAGKDREHGETRQCAW